MKTFTMWLLDGKEITLKGKTYEDLMCEIDNTLDIFKENVAYYLGADDDSIIEERDKVCCTFGCKGEKEELLAELEELDNMEEEWYVNK